MSLLLLNSGTPCTSLLSQQSHAIKTKSAVAATTVVNAAVERRINATSAVASAQGMVELPHRVIFFVLRMQFGTIPWAGVGCMLHHAGHKYR